MRQAAKRAAAIRTVPAVLTATTFLTAAVCLTATVCLDATVLAAPQEDAPPPRDSGLVERAASRIVQLDVTVEGSPEAIGSLTPDDFEVLVAGELVEGFAVDRICDLSGPDATPDSGAEGTGTDGTDPATAAPPRAPTSYLFYFDQAFLTVEGRVRALDMARDLMDRLVASGDPVTVVSSGQVLRTYADVARDPQEARDALAGIEDDPQQWFPTLRPEDEKLGEVLDALRDPRRGGTERAMQMARQFQAQEAWVTDKAMRRLSMVLGRFADVPPPKVAIYFADRLRSKAGQQYLDLFGAAMRDNTTLSNMDTRALRTLHAFDRVVSEANANGIRLYTVQAEGLVGPSITGANQSTAHIRSAQDSLKGMALETGGRAFLNGLRTEKIARAIREDLRCLFLLSLPADDLPQDRELALRVRIDRKGVRAFVRGQLYVQSEAERDVSRLMAAFAAPDVNAADERVRAVLIPVGYEDDAYRALLQMSVEGSPVPGARWDLGASLLSDGRVREDFRGGVTVTGAGVPVVLEAEVRVRPGPFEVALVAHDTGTDRVLTGRLEGDWPAVRGNETFVGPTAVLQPAAAAFVRDGAVRTEGALGYRPGDLLDVRRTTALIGLVCRGNLGSKRPFLVERRLVGSTAASFEPVPVELEEPGCVQIRDFVKPDQMTEGGFDWEIRLYRKGEPLATGTRRFLARAEATADSGGPTEDLQE